MYYNKQQIIMNVRLIFHYIWFEVTGSSAYKFILKYVCILRNIYLIKGNSTSQVFFYTWFYILVPQAVNQWIEHGDHKSIKQWGHFVLIQGIGRTWPEIHEEHCSLENCNNCQMGSTCGESFESPFSGANLQDW